MRNSERIGLLIGVSGLMLAVMNVTSHNANAATPGGSGSPYGPTPAPGSTPPAGGSQVTYGTFAGPVRGDASIWRAQRELEALGYDPRGDDGLFGPDTRRALNDFQRDYGQPVTSTLTSGAIANLEREYARIAPPGAVGDLSPAAYARGSYRSRY